MLEIQESAHFVKWKLLPLSVTRIVIGAFARIVPGSTKSIHTISAMKVAVVMDNPTITQYNASIHQLKLT
jgi:hypothetical protein